MKALFTTIFFLMAATIFAQKTTKPIPFTLRAVDEKTFLDVPSSYIIKQVFGKKEMKAETSKLSPTFKFIIDKADTIIIETVSDGYYTIEETMYVSCDTCAGYQHVAMMEKKDSVFRDLKVNQSIRLDNVYFAQSSYELRTESYEQLVKLEKTLRNNPTLTIEIAGHTDNVGDRRLNQILSENRAKVIVNFLNNRGISDKRMQANGYGDTHPDAPNDTEDNKKLNRRVEFKVLAF
jgi:OmpA-OmpF porin, OOP family